MQRPRLKRKKIILGLTGGFGSGKTSVASILRSYGAEIIDADTIAHNCYRPASSAYKKIINIFGRDILGRDKKIGRKKLGSKVFTDKRLLKKLNSIIHPRVKGIIRDKIRRAKRKVVVIDAPLLIETGLHGIVDKLIVVKVSKLEQLKRIKKRDALSRGQILKRIKAQVPLRCKVRLADFIIDNSGRKEETKRQVKNIWRELWKN